MSNLPRVAQLFFRAAVTGLVPLALALTALRLLLTPVFVRLEYRTPNFPPDPYGMTQEERLRWAPLALAYLLNDEGIEYLGEMSFEDGTRLYNQRELDHMDDVKVLVQAALRVWVGVLLALGAAGWWARRNGAWRVYAKMLSDGGGLTILVVLTLLAYLALNFNQLFVSFHAVFFEGDTWLFAFSDTLIRLFPVRFWRDAFMLVGGLTLSGALVLWWWGRRPTKN